MEASAKKLQETQFSEYYSSCFDSWKDEFIDSYNRYNSQLSKVANSLIVNHEYVSDQVTKTTFENGYAVYVNFGYVDFVAADGSTIVRINFNNNAIRAWQRTNSNIVGITLTYEAVVTEKAKVNSDEKI